MASSGVDLIAEGIAALAGEEIEGRWLGDDLIGLFGLVDRLRAECSRRVGCSTAVAMVMQTGTSRRLVGSPIVAARM